MTNPEPKCQVCGEGGPFDRHGHPRREEFTPPIPGLASISDEKVLWLFDQIAALRAENETHESYIVTLMCQYEGMREALSEGRAILARKDKRPE